MTRVFAISSVLVFLFACALEAQAPAPTLSAETKQAWTAIKGNLLKAADKMSEADYSFKPTSEIRSFGEMIAHISDSALRTCAAVKGEQQKADAATKTTKAELTAALKASFDYCDTAYNTLTDANAMEIVKAGRGGRTRAFALAYNTAHMNESYGYIAVYMRLKGVTPPSSEK
ncbi:MAG: DinB family protein [Bryobacterales bacterium]|nr:DinB family protein [Bryobacterales bacterium]